MAYYSSELTNKVKQIDLLTYLKNFEPEELVTICRGNYSTKTHDSLKISNGMWYWFSKNIGGKSALDYLIKVRGYSFLEAMQILLDKIKNNKDYKVYNNENSVPKVFSLPIKAEKNNRAIAYLLKRGIDLSIIDECIRLNLIYQDINKNVVFVGYDENNKVKYAMCRGTGNIRFMKEVSGSSKEYSFRLALNEENTDVHLFESAIDLLSYATLLKMKHKDWHNYNLLSFGGIYIPNNLEYSRLPLPLLNYLKHHPNVKKIIMHLDNDETGRLASQAIYNVLSKGFEVIDQPVTIGKDVNDFLCYLKKDLKKDSR